MALNVHGCCALTCITAQNSFEVNCVEAVERNTLISQLDTLFSDFNIKLMDPNIDSYFIPENKQHPSSNPSCLSVVSLSTP